VVATRNKAPFTASVDPGTGTHKLKAYVTFSDTTPAKTLQIPVKSCDAGGALGDAARQRRASPVDERA
jgi:hypothetical protein